MSLQRTNMLIVMHSGLDERISVQPAANTGLRLTGDTPGALDMYNLPIGAFLGSRFICSLNAGYT